MSTSTGKGQETFSTGTLDSQLEQPQRRSRARCWKRRLPGNIVADEWGGNMRYAESRHNDAPVSGPRHAFPLCRSSKPVPPLNTKTENQQHSSKSVPPPARSSETVPPRIHPHPVRPLAWSVPSPFFQLFLYLFSILFSNYPPPPTRFNSPPLTADPPQPFFLDVPTHMCTLDARKRVFPSNFRVAVL